jgi:hypothetical protein
LRVSWNTSSIRVHTNQSVIGNQRTTEILK